MNTLLIIVIAITNLYCSAQEQNAFTAKEVYKTSELIVTQITGNTFVHTSYKQTNDFGNVPCNGLIVRDGDEVIVFDTPTSDGSSEELIRWIKGTLRCKINAIIPTHFHDDCLGGLKAFHKNGIPSYAYFKTIELAARNGLPVPDNEFRDLLVLKAGNENVITSYFGEGHTPDNIVGYFPREKVMFGGCLIKESGAGKGYLGDANVSEWSGTVERIKKYYPDVKVVVPGHGEYGNKKLLDYTINLFRAQ